MSGVSKSTKEARSKEFVTITGATQSDALRLLKAVSWRLEAALDNFYNSPTSATMDGQKDGAKGGANVKLLEKLWSKYADAKSPEETDIDGTIAYCQDLGVEPEDVVMLGIAWITKAPTMGRFGKKGWIEGWKDLRKDSLELQRSYIPQLRSRLSDGDVFRKIYNFTFDYAKTEGQKSMQLEIAQELWNLLIPLDPASDYPSKYLQWWQDFLISRGGRAISKDTWNLFLEFCRTIDPMFETYDEEAAWPSLIDEFVVHARTLLKEGK